MSNTLRKALRREIYTLLIIKHKKPIEISKALNLTLPTVLYHISVISKENAIRRVGYGAYSNYSRGPEFHQYETMTSNIMGDGQEESIRKPNVRRIDTAWFKCEIIKPWPEELVWWESESKFGTVMKRTRKIFWGKWSATITAYDQKSILMQILPFEIDEKEIPYRDEIAMTYAIQVVRIASKAFKIGLSLPELTTEPYICKPLPELQGIHVGTIQTSPTSHIDSSKRGGGQPEWETNSKEEAIAEMQLPHRVLTLEKRFELLDLRLERIEHNMDRIASAIEKNAEAMEKLVNNITRESDNRPIKPLDQQDQGAYR